MQEKKIFITSDTHFCHNREFLYTPRGSTSIEEMNEMVITNWNSVVGEEDEVYLLGDVMLNDDEVGLECLSRLNGIIHIIRGNHDTDNRLPKYFSAHNVKDILDIKRLRYNGYHFYLSHYPTLTDNFDSDKPLKSRVINLCGHSHTQDKWADISKGLIYHCELDAHNCTPVLLDDIIADIQQKYYEYVQSKVQENE